MRNKLIVFYALLGVGMLAFFQNCTSSFEAIPGSSNSTLQTPLTPTPTVVPTMSPTPQNSAQLEKTFFYLGRNAAIDAVELDHRSGSVREISTTSTVVKGVGWLAYDRASGQVLAADANNGGKLEVFEAFNNGTLSSRSVQNYISGVVHLVAAPTILGFRLFAANYDAGTLSYHLYAGNAPQQVQVINFGTGAKAHSSAFVPSRHLLFVATLGLNKISVYRVSDSGLTAVGFIAIDSPRTVVYDPIYDKVYVSTEMYSGTSYIKGYAINEPTAGTYAFTEVASQAMAQVGADLKVNHTHGYIMATSREIGKQAINGMPVTATGSFDSSRSSFVISMSQIQPRSIEVTEDGQYALVAMNSSSAANVVAFKLVFDGAHRFQRSDKIFEQKIGTTGYLCAVSVPYYSQ